MNNIGRTYCRGGETAWNLMISVMLVMLVACGNKTTAVGLDESRQEVASPYHADNDIAMTVCSLVDAVRVGEPLDSADYNFQGILTDGQGTPLYTDIEGNPGEWEVIVIGDDEARISNLQLGDLLTEDLRNYIVGALNLNDADLATAYVNPADEQEFIWLYDMGDVQLVFSETLVKMPSGLDGIIMSVSVFKK
ncbi:MAG: hypothetical protein K2K98_05810 [Muribaculaceae bacterium]|nr:hypothetical protein [Muribaculaceae bacterium]